MAPYQLPSPLSSARGQSLLGCPLCGFTHAAVPLAQGQRATCVRCGTLLCARGRLGPHAPAAFALAGLLLAWPALSLPFITVAKFGNFRPTWLHTGAEGLWNGGMPVLGTWVLTCGILAPLLLLGLLAALLAGDTRGAPDLHRQLLRLARSLAHWAMPEVHLLAVLVAMIKLGALVDVFIGAGFWCYAAMSLMLVLAWRSFGFEPSVSTTDGRRDPAP